MQQLKKIVPRVLRTRHFYDMPPRVLKMPLLRNVPSLTFRNVHHSSGAPRSRCLFSLLHYKFDIDLPMKVELALRERQYWSGSREYEAYARILSKSRFDVRFAGTHRFEGVQSLVDAKLAYLDTAARENCAGSSHPSVLEVASQVWEYGDHALQVQAWERAWGPTGSPLAQPVADPR